MGLETLVVAVLVMFSFFSLQSSDGPSVAFVVAAVCILCRELVGGATPIGEMRRT